MELDPDFNPNKSIPTLVRTKYTQLQTVRNNLLESYHSEFLKNLKKDRFKPVYHKYVQKGDLVLIR